MPFGRESRKISLGSKPHLLVGTMLGTLATFVVFVNHYTTLKDDGSGETWVWFGIRSDGRCGRDYAHEGQLSAGETQCGKGQCCSSHGWCGHGEEYCSVSMGCQSGCWPASGADEAKRDADDHYRHNEHTPDDEEYMDRMHHYKYDDDRYEHYKHHTDEYRQRDEYYRNDEPHEYHHRYDDMDHDHHDTRYPDGDDYHPQHGDDHGHGHGHGDDDDDDDDSYDDDPHHPHDKDRGHHDVLHNQVHGSEMHADHHHELAYRYDHKEERDGRHGAGHGGQGDGGAEINKGPELVGLEEKRHLGEGDGVPLHGEEGPEG